MDGQRFDDLAKSLARRSLSRRGVFRSGIAAVISGMLPSSLKRERAVAASQEAASAFAGRRHCRSGGMCLMCDLTQDSGRTSCAPCDDHCLSADLAAAAANDPTYQRLKQELRQRGFRETNAQQSIAFKGHGAAYGMTFIERSRPHRHAQLVYTPVDRPNRTALVVLSLRNTIDSALGLDESGAVVEEAAANLDLTGATVGTVAGLRAFPGLQVVPGWDPLKCSLCYERCEAANAASGNAVICGLAGAAVCARTKSPLAIVGCAVAASYACNKGVAECSYLMCEGLEGCPRECDPHCETRQPDGSCRDVCAAANTHCRAGTCLCDWVACGDHCCSESEYCKEGACVASCGHCWFPNNEGQCFDVCLDAGASEPRPCCISNEHPNGYCCFAREGCCESGCVDLSNDNHNCGECNAACPDSSTCVDGHCVCGDQECAGDSTCCGTTCCPGPCNSVGDDCCPADQLCHDGSCCPDVQECCSDGCCEGACGADGKCCPFERICKGPCCAEGEECCPDLTCRPVGTCCMGAQICGTQCCQDNQTCCGGTCCDGPCDESGNACCAGGQICGDACCPAGQQCCGGSCAEECGACAPGEVPCDLTDRAYGGIACCGEGSQCCPGNLLWYCGPDPQTGLCCGPGETDCYTTCCAPGLYCGTSRVSGASGEVATCCPDMQEPCGGGCCGVDQICVTRDNREVCQ